MRLEIGIHYPCFLCFIHPANAVINTVCPAGVTSNHMESTNNINKKTQFIFKRIVLIICSSSSSAHPPSCAYNISWLSQTLDNPLIFSDTVKVAERLEPFSSCYDSVMTLISFHIHGKARAPSVRGNPGPEGCYTTVPM